MSKKTATGTRELLEKVFHQGYLEGFKDGYTSGYQDSSEDCLPCDLGDEDYFDDDEDEVEVQLKFNF
jgi:hypothetical protein